MDWDDVRHFLALARSGSVRAAGSSLGVSHSTVARRVEALEGKLGARLFDRHRDGYTLTEAGRSMVPGAERVEAELAALERGLVGTDSRLAGPVSITCCDNHVGDLVLRELAPFCQQAEGIELCFTTDSRPFDLSKREADIALRTLAKDQLPPQHLIGTRLAPVVVASYVARDHAQRLDPSLSDAPTRWLAFADQRVSERMIAGTSHPDVPAWGAFNCFELAVAALREGLGIAMLPTYVGDRDPALRRLVHADLRHLADIWLLSHVDLRDNARFRATRAAVADAVRKHLPLFRGEGWSAGAPVGPENAPDGS